MLLGVPFLLYTWSPGQASLGMSSRLTLLGEGQV